ncbi:MAG: hypothetical protein DRG20_01470 [Deltaproteobacteria bacterium]|nr:response regulator [Deltaproteobacteria bacterium]RLA91414.1 MAG: hypothetical protein DRG20_01470 [Deltaproteobacteria bacterium]
MKKETLLIVDDEMANLRLLEMILSPYNYKITKTLSGLETLDILKKEKVDLVLLDVVMPNVDGFEICKRIREELGLRTIPIIMITARALSENDLIKGLEVGANDYIRKPVDPQEVVARVKAHIRIKNLYNEIDKARKQVEESEEKYRTLVENSLAGVILVKDDNIMYINIRGIKIFGYKKKKDVLGKKLSSFIDKQGIKKIKEKIEKIKQGKRVMPLVITKGKTAKEESIDLEICVNPIIIKNEEHILANFRDITWKKKLEEETREKERLIGAIQMAGAAAHEINQPLTVVLSQTELLLSEVGLPSSANQRAKKIIEATERIREIIVKISSISKYKTKKYIEGIKIIDIEKALNKKNRQ